MDIIELKAPSPEYAADIWQFRQEILEKDAGNKDQFAGCGGLENCTSAEEWIERMKLGESEENCKDGKVPSHMYLAVRKADNRIVGLIDLRHHINHPILGTWGGHSGYSVRPSESKAYWKFRRDSRQEQQQKIQAEVFQKELIHIKLVIHKTPPVSHWAFALSCKIHYRIQGVHILS